jgi:pectinesterase
VQYLDFMGAALDGCGSHPGVLGHQQMAAKATPIISAAMGWKEGSRDGGVGADVVGGRAPSGGAADGGAALLERARAVSASRLRNAEAAAASAAAAAAAARARTPPPPPIVNVTVRSDGSGDFSSVQAALDACNATGDPAQLGHVTLHLLGVFRERVEISPLFVNGVTLVGDGDAAGDALIVFNRAGANWSTWNSWTMRVGAADVTLSRVAVANDAAGFDSSVAGQSVALHLAVTADRFACLGCALFGAQDTLYTGGAGFGLRSYFGGSGGGGGAVRAFINGSCDAIFGGSSSVFEDVALEMSSTATAPRGEPASAFLFLGCSLDGRAGGAGGAALLGRPWGQLSTEVWLDARLSAAVDPAGWSDFGHDCAATGWCAPVLFAEHNSSGAGADPAARVAWSRQLNASEAARWTRDRVLRGWEPPTEAAPRRR